MGSILQYARDDMVFGVDTETYNDDGHIGLKSIQVWNPKESHYFTVKDFNRPDLEIRYDICRQFFEWIGTDSHTLVFFNMDFDFSQMVKYAIQESGLEYIDGKMTSQTYAISILESDSNIYKVTTQHEKGVRNVFIDITNFLTATTLDNACKEWLGKQKVELESKEFRKCAATPLEKEYAMKDAELTYELYKAINDAGVTEDTKYVTIASRTIGHFRDFLKKEYSMSFNEFCYGTNDKEYCQMCNYEWEQYLRGSLRGGICMAIHKGRFDNCKHIDATSMYPSQMNLDYIPTGSVYFEPPETEYTTIHFPSCYLELKTGGFPYLQWNSKAMCAQYRFKKLYEPSEFVHDAMLDGTYAFWDAEWQIILANYDVWDLEDQPIYIAMKKNVALKRYINILFQGKKNNTGSKKYFYKILMNSLYGKFLSRPDGKKISYSGGERHIEEETDRQLYYLPLGSWIAMMGRVTLAKCIMSIGMDNALYCDTDSCIYRGNKEPDVRIGKELGTWGIENFDFDVYIVGPKAYQEMNHDGRLVTKCAGINADVRGNIPFEGLKEGEHYLVRRAKRDPETWAKNVVISDFVINTRRSVYR